MEEPYRYILIVVIILCCQIALQVALTYFQQRARNKADLAFKNKLTSIEEAIKTANALQIDRSKQIFSEEKDSIIVFFAQLNTWIWEALNINIYDYLNENIDKIPNRITMMSDGYNKTKIAFAKVTLIITDEDLINLGKEAIVKTLMIHQLRYKSLKNLYEYGIENRGYEKELSKMDFDNYSYEIMELNGAIENLDTMKIKVIKEFNSMDFNTAIETLNSFKNSARDYIRK